MKLLGSTKSHINKDKNGTNVYHIEINEVVLVIVQESLYTFFPKNILVNYLIQNVHVLKYGLLLKVINY